MLTPFTMCVATMFPANQWRGTPVSVTPGLRGFGTIL
jgi:hypothetical protein